MALDLEDYLHYVSNISAAARALVEATELDAEEIAERAMKVASDLCVYTNNRFVKEVITWSK